MCDRRRKSTGKPKNRVVHPMPICSFCLGDEENNRKGQPEEFISCVDCGNSGHPSCLKFSAALVQRVKQTKWQCIDCKRCARCEGIGLDENMLFCDSCDRGVHMKCCIPPLKELPTGEWFCFLCESLPLAKESATEATVDTTPTAKHKKTSAGSAAKLNKSVKAAVRTPRSISSSVQKSTRRNEDKSTANSTSGTGKPGCNTDARSDLVDGLTVFFTPANKRKSRVSSASLEGISATVSAPVEAGHSKLLRSQAVKTVAKLSNRYKAAYHPIKRLQKKRSMHFQKDRDRRRNCRLRTITALQDGLSEYFTACGSRKSMFRRAESVGRESSHSPSMTAVKNRRRLQRGDRVDHLFDGLTHFFTAHGKRPSVFRRPDEDESQTDKVEGGSSSDWPKLHHRYRHRTQVQLLCDGLSKFYTAKGEKRSQTGEISPGPSHAGLSKEPLIETKNCESHRSGQKKRPVEDACNEPLLSSGANTKRLKPMVNRQSNTQRSANRILEKSRQFQARSKKKMRCRRRDSSQLKSLYDGLSHLYAAQGERKRKSFNFYCLTPRRRASQIKEEDLADVGAAHLEEAPESTMMSKPTPTVSSCPRKSLDGVKNDRKTKLEATSDIEEDGMLRKLTSKTKVGGSVTPEMKTQKRSSPGTGLKSLSDGITKDDMDLFDEAMSTSQLKFVRQEGSSTAEASPGCIEIGKYEINSWHSSPYPVDYANLHKLYICEFCLKCFKSRAVVQNHMTKCTLYHPPGDEIYRSGSLSVYEVDGKVNKQYCQNLCLLAKLFLDHKTLYYDVEPFLFYVLTHTDDGGSHLIGYFSKEKYCQQKFNLSCIMTLPPYQRRGYGRFLIQFSYLLSRLEGQPGSPEKPLSDLGRVSYCAYWKSVLVEYLHKQKDLSNISIKTISDATGLTLGDIVTTLQSLNMVSVKDSKCVVVVQRSVLDDFLNVAKARQEHQIPLNEDCLRWSPFVAVLAGDREDKEKTVAETSNVNESRITENSKNAGTNMPSNVCLESDKTIENASGKRRTRSQKNNNNDTDKQYNEGVENDSRKTKLSHELFPPHQFDKQLDSEAMRDESSGYSESSMEDTAQNKNGYENGLNGNFHSRVPQKNSRVAEQQDQKNLRKSSDGNKKLERSRGSCSNRSPQVDKEHPNKPRKKTKSYLLIMRNFAAKDRQGTSVECQSESRDASEKSSEVSDEPPAAVTGSEVLLSSCDITLGKIGTRIISDDQNISTLDPLSSSSAEDGEEFEEDFLARAKDMKTVVDLSCGNEIFPNALSSTQPVLGPFRNPGDSDPTVTGLTAANLDEGFSSTDDASEKIRNVSRDSLLSCFTADSFKTASNDEVTGENELNRMRQASRDSILNPSCDLSMEVSLISRRHFEGYDIDPVCSSNRPVEVSSKRRETEGETGNQLADPVSTHPTSEIASQAYVSLPSDCSVHQNDPFLITHSLPPGISFNLTSSSTGCNSPVHPNPFVMSLKNGNEDNSCSMSTSSALSWELDVTYSPTPAAVYHTPEGCNFRPFPHPDAKMPPSKPCQAKSINVAYDLKPSEDDYFLQSVSSVEYQRRAVQSQTSFVIPHSHSPFQSPPAIWTDKTHPGTEVESITDATSHSFEHNKLGHYSGFRSHIPNLNLRDSSGLADNSDCYYTGDTSFQRNKTDANFHSNVLTPPPSYERRQVNPHRIQTQAYPFSYCVYPYDSRSETRTRNQYFARKHFEGHYQMTM